MAEELAGEGGDSFDYEAGWNMFGGCAVGWRVFAPARRDVAQWRDCGIALLSRKPDAGGDDGGDVD